MAHKTLMDIAKNVGKKKRRKKSFMGDYLDKLEKIRAGGTSGGSIKRRLRRPRSGTVKKKEPTPQPEISPRVKRGGPQTKNPSPQKVGSLAYYTSEMAEAGERATKKRKAYYTSEAMKKRKRRRKK